MTDTRLPHERLDDLFAWIEEQKAAGRSEEDIAAELRGIDEMFLEQAVQAAVEGGQDETTVREFFQQMGIVLDHEPLDAVDEGDPDYVAEVPV